MLVVCEIFAHAEKKNSCDNDMVIMWWWHNYYMTVRWQIWEAWSKEPLALLSTYIRVCIYIYIYREEISSFQSDLTTCKRTQYNPRERQGPFTIDYGRDKVRLRRKKSSLFVALTMISGEREREIGGPFVSGKN